MTFKIGRLVPFLLLLSILLPAATAFAQQRDLYTQRLVLDDNAAGGTMNRLTLAIAGDLPADRTLTIPDPGAGTAEFLLAVSGSAGISKIETPGADETLRLNPSGDLVQIGNDGDASGSDGLDVYGSVDIVGRRFSLDESDGDGAITVDNNNVELSGRDIRLMVTENVIINGNLVVKGNLNVMGGLTVSGEIVGESSDNRIGSGDDLRQLMVLGQMEGSDDHLYVIGNIRLTDELRIGEGGNSSIFRTGAQSGDITYTLPTALPAAAATGTSMGRGLMQVTNDGTMSWRNVGSASGALNFGSTADGATSDMTIALTGAVPGDMVVLGIPNASQPAGSAWYQAWVSANNQVTVRFFNETGGNVDPASGTFNVMVVRP